MSSLSDPRVLFAAERTMLAWNRTSISFMAFGFVVERFGLVIHKINTVSVDISQREVSFYIGIFLMSMAIVISFLSILQYKNVLLSLSRSEIPRGYNIWLSAIVNGVVGLMGMALIYYVFQEL